MKKEDASGAAQWSSAIVVTPSLAELREKQRVREVNDAERRLSWERGSDDELIERRLRDTVFCVEATAFEKLTLWREYHQERDVSWEQLDPGSGRVVGELANRPVVITLTWDVIEDQLVLFWEAVSQVVDHAMIERWFEQHCAPRYDECRRPARSNAMNFSHCLDAIDELNDVKNGRTRRRR